MSPQEAREVAWEQGHEDQCSGRGRGCLPEYGLRGGDWRLAVEVLGEEDALACRADGWDAAADAERESAGGAL